MSFIRDDVPKRLSLIDRPAAELTAEQLHAAMDALWTETRLPLPLSRRP